MGGSPMKAVVWHGVGDIRFEDVPEPKVQAPTDAIVRITTVIRWRHGSGRPVERSPIGR